MEKLSLGQTVLDAHEVKGIPVITGNYVSPNYEMPLPGPLGDWYLRQTFVPAVQSGETVVCHTLIDGLENYYREIGLIPASAKIIEVEPNKANGVSYGFPATDPLEILRGHVALENGRGESFYLASTFASPEIASQSRDLGIKNLIRPESRLTNNKAELRRASEIYGYHMIPGKNLRNWEDLEMIGQETWNTEHGVWLKFPTGSGGDLVYRISERATPELLREGVRTLRKRVEQSFSEGHFGVDVEQFWPNERLSPEGYPLVLEADAHFVGEVLANGSTQFITRKDSRVSIIGHFTQITTDEGEYLGNEPYTSITKEVRKLADDQTRMVADYNLAQGYFGIQGIDWFLTRGKDSTLRISITELNSRPTANTPPVIIAEKLAASHWINTNVYTDSPIRNIGDYIETIGEDYAYGKADGIGMVVPQSFRTFIRRGEIEASPNFKVVILGRDKVHCRQIQETLLNRGVRFSP